MNKRLILVLLPLLLLFVFSAQTYSPVARFTFSPSNPEPEETVNFNGAESVDVDGSILHYYWDFGESINASWLSPTSHDDPDEDWANDHYAYDDELSTGAYANLPATWCSFLYLNRSSPMKINAIQLTASPSVVSDSFVDIDGKAINGSWNDLYLGNWTEQAAYQYHEFSCDIIITRELRVRFNASASQGVFLDEVDFVGEELPTGSIVNHTYAESDSYTVTLTVCDNDGLSDTFSQTITVEDVVDDRWVLGVMYGVGGGFIFGILALVTIVQKERNITE